MNKGRGSESTALAKIEAARTVMTVGKCERRCRSASRRIPRAHGAGPLGTRASCAAASTRTSRPTSANWHRTPWEPRHIDAMLRAHCGQRRAAMGTAHVRHPRDPSLGASCRARAMASRPRQLGLVSHCLHEALVGDKPRHRKLQPASLCCLTRCSERRARRALRTSDEGPLLAPNPPGTNLGPCASPQG